MIAKNRTRHLLVVEDSPTQAKRLQLILQSEGFDAEIAPNGERARNRLEQQEFALALVDVNLPGESGVELVKHISSEHPETAAVMVTVLDDRQIAEAALDMGAYGYFIKPIKPNELLINISSALRRRDLELQHRAERETLQQTVLERTAALQKAVDRLKLAEQDVRLSEEETILRLARAGECRDDETGRHVQRMSRYCGLLAQRIGLQVERCEQIRLASIMHDVGKIGIPDGVLRKTGPLTPYEFEVMKQHAQIGYRILVGSQRELLQLAATVAWTHHEKYDGSGYPEGLSGEAIPLEGKIAAIADVFDALTNDRVYRPAYTLDKALAIMREGRGTHFDHSLLDLFLDSMDEAQAIKEQYADK